MGGLHRICAIEYKFFRNKFVKHVAHYMVAGDYKEMSPMFANQMHPRISSPNAGGGGDCGVGSHSANECGCALCSVIG